MKTARSDVVGSLLRPTWLREARQRAADGTLAEPELKALEDRAVREAIALQESAGIDAITDGELRRNSWVVTIPLREVGAAHAPLAGYEFLPADAGWWSLWKEPDGRRANVWTAPTRYVPLDRLALSPQCGFASGEAGNPLTPEQQEAKLRRVGEVARTVWRS